MLETQLTGQAREFLHSFEGVLPTIQISPHRAPGPQPIGLQVIGKKFRVRAGRDVADDIAVNQRVKIRSDHNHSPWSSDRSFDSGRLRQAPGLFFAVSEIEWMAYWQCVTQDRLETSPAI